MCSRAEVQGTDRNMFCTKKAAALKDILFFCCLYKFVQLKSSKISEQRFTQDPLPTKKIQF